MPPFGRHSCHPPSNPSLKTNSSTPRGIGSMPRGVDEFVFNDGFEGGWQECLPNGGISVMYKGAQLPFHGELLALPWEVTIVEDRPEIVSVRFSVRTLRTPFLLEKVLTLRS